MFAPAQKYWEEWERCLATGYVPLPPVNALLSLPAFNHSGRFSMVASNKSDGFTAALVPVVAKKCLGCSTISRTTPYL